MSPRLQEESSIHDQFVFHWTCSKKQSFQHHFAGKSYLYNSNFALFALSYRARVSKMPHSADKITLTSSVSQFFLLFTF